MDMESTPTTIGNTLRQVREERGLALRDAERDTRIDRRYLEALEGDDLTVFPVEAHARGFLRAYASYLGVPSDVIDSAIRTAEEPTGDVATGRRRRDQKRTTPVRVTPLPIPRPPNHAPDPNAEAEQPDPLRTPPAGRINLRFGLGLRIGLLATGGLAVALLIGILAGSTGNVGKTTPNGGVTIEAGRGAATRPSISAAMPDLIGLNQQEALARLQALGVTPVVVEWPATGGNRPIVRQQSPAAKTEIGRATVTLVMSPP